MYLQPESVIIHVDDPLGRVVKDGSAIWSTGRLMNLADSQTRLTSSWQINEAVTVTAPGGGDAPGRWLLTNTDDGHGNFDLLDAPDSTRVEYSLFSLSDLGTDPRDYFLDVKVDFWALGTYKALFEIKGVLSGTTYTDSGTYIFHVGPVAELEVRDGGANPQVAGNRGAYTIEAVNNGPSDAGGVRVTLTGVPEGAVAEASRGDYDPGDLRPGRPLRGLLDHRRARDPGISSARWQGRDGNPDPHRRRESRSPPPSKVPGTTRSASTAMSRTWPRPASRPAKPAATAGTARSTTITSPRTTQRRLRRRTGTGLGHPGAPASLRARQYASVVFLDWQSVERLNGYPATHYEVMRQRGTFWEPLSSSVDSSMYVDLNPGQQLRSYRVRAVNRFGVVGPWSWPSAGDSPQVRTTAPRDFTATVSLDGRMVDLAWLPAATEGATVNRYELEWRQRTSDPWDCLRAYPAAPCAAAVANDATAHEHTLPEGVDGVGTYYRIRAVFDDGIAGAWATARAVDMVPGIPAASGLSCPIAATPRC